jgi:hypothetical protein
VPQRKITLAIANETLKIRSRFSKLRAGKGRPVFVFFSNNLGCGTSLLISAVVTVLLLLVTGVIELS